MKVICNEKGVDVEREVKEMPRDPETILHVYDRLGTVPHFFGSKKGKDIIEGLYDTRFKFWLVDDVGIICACPIAQGKGHAHITFWDSRLRGREELARCVAREAMQQLDLHTLVTAVPVSSRATLAFAKRVGFLTVGKNEEAELLYITKEAL